MFELLKENLASERLEVRKFKHFEPTIHQEIVKTTFKSRINVTYAVYNSMIELILNIEIEFADTDIFV